MKKKAKIVWIWKVDGSYRVGGRKPTHGRPWYASRDSWVGLFVKSFCANSFERLFPFFKMPANSLGKITNTANTLTFEIVETKK